MLAGRGKVRIRGIEELDRKLRQLPQVVEAAGRRAVKDEVHAVAQQMRADAPVDDGDLLRGIQEELEKKGLEGAAVSTARHTTFVVHGTSDTPANDFMEPATQESRRRFPDRVRDEVRDELRKLGK